VFATLLLLAITNTVTIVPLPKAMCYDLAVFGASWDTHDTNPVYGLKIQALDANNQVVAEGWVEESYSPPVTETVVATLTSAAVNVRCEVFGPNLAGKWKEGYLAVLVNRPRLTIRKTSAGIQIDWPDPGHCWQLERVAGSTNRFEFFRLRRP
jgi:hypothetical protein